MKIQIENVFKNDSRFGLMKIFFCYKTCQLVLLLQNMSTCSSVTKHVNLFMILCFFIRNFFFSQATFTYIHEDNEVENSGLENNRYNPHPKGERPYTDETEGEDDVINTSLCSWILVVIGFHDKPAYVIYSNFFFFFFFFRYLFHCEIEVITGVFR